MVVILVVATPYVQTPEGHMFADARRDIQEMGNLAQVREEPPCNY